MISESLSGTRSLSMKQKESEWKDMLATQVSVSEEPESEMEEIEESEDEESEDDKEDGFTPPPPPPEVLREVYSDSPRGDALFYSMKEKEAEWENRMTSSREWIDE